MFVVVIEQPVGTGRGPGCSGKTPGDDFGNAAWHKSSEGSGVGLLETGQQFLAIRRIFDFDIDRVALAQIAHFRARFPSHFRDVDAG